jgi:ketosteroid isomerase-like protein
MRFALSIILGLLIQSVALEQAPEMRTANSPEQELLNLERQKDEAILRADKAALERLYADDYSKVNSIGRIVSRKDAIEFFAQHGVVFESYTSAEISVRLSGDTAVVTGIYKYKTSRARGFKGDDPFRYRYTNIYVKRASGWQIVASQDTRIEP